MTPGSTARILHAISRFSATPETLALRLTPEGYVGAGSVADFNLAIAREAFLEAAPATEEGALTVDELCKATGVARATGYRAIEELVTAGALTRAGTGKRGDPYRQFLLQGSDS